MNQAQAQVEHHIEHVVSKDEPNVSYQEVITLKAGAFSLELRSPKHPSRFGAESWYKLLMALIEGSEIRAEIGQEMSTAQGGVTLSIP